MERTMFVVSCTLLFHAWLCFLGAKGMLKPAEKHASFTRLDQHLPLRGRWLRYAAAAFLALLGTTALLLGVVMAWYPRVIVSWILNLL